MLVSLTLMISYTTIQLLIFLSPALLCCLKILRHFVDLLLQALYFDYVLLR